MALVDRWEAGRTHPECEISEISEISPPPPPLFSLISLISQPEEDGEDWEIPENPPAAEPRTATCSTSETRGVCTCDERPFPHWRHKDGSGPGSGRPLAPHDHQQAHRSAGRASVPSPRCRGEWRVGRYRWQQVCHDGACDTAVEIPGSGPACSRCFPIAGGFGRGRLVRVTGKCTASIHAAEHMVWVPAGDGAAARYVSARAFIKEE